LLLKWSVFYSDIVTADAVAVSSLSGVSTEREDCIYLILKD
jgi:hypothetical protein